MIKYEEIEDLCTKFNIEIDYKEGTYCAVNRTIQRSCLREALPSYMASAIEHYGEKLYRQFNKKPTTNQLTAKAVDLPFPILCYSELFQDYFTFEQDSIGNIKKLEFASCVIYEGELLQQFMQMPKEDKLKIHMIRREFL